MEIRLCWRFIDDNDRISRYEYFIMVLKKDYNLSTVLFELSGAGLKQKGRKQTAAPVTECKEENSCILFHALG